VCMQNTDATDKAELARICARAGDIATGRGCHAAAAILYRTAIRLAGEALREQATNLGVDTNGQGV
jgi:hypothetical protein